MFFRYSTVDEKYIANVCSNTCTAQISNSFFSHWEHLHKNFNLLDALHSQDYKDVRRCAHTPESNIYWTWEGPPAVDLIRFRKLPNISCCHRHVPKSETHVQQRCVAFPLCSVGLCNVVTWQALPLSNNGNFLASQAPGKVVSTGTLVVCKLSLVGQWVEVHLWGGWGLLQCY